MHHQLQVSIKNTTDIPCYEQALIRYLAFRQVELSAQTPLFKGSSCVETFSSLPFVRIAKLDMFAHITRFIHSDCDNHCQKHCILIHSLSGLIVSAQKKQVHLPAGSYILIPAWEPFTLKSQSRHYGLIFTLDIASAGLNTRCLYALYWKVGNHLRYGNMLNNLLCDYYAPLTDTCYKQLLSSINILLLLQSEQAFCPCNFNKSHFIPDFDVSAIVHTIRQNMTNPDYSLHDLSDYFGMTVRVLQYKLAHYQLSFSELLASVRCELLAMTIRNMPDVNLDVLARNCGFTSRRMANRQFKKLRGETVNQFQDRERSDRAKSAKTVRRIF